MIEKTHDEIQSLETRSAHSGEAKADVHDYRVGNETSIDTYVFDIQSRAKYRKK